MNAGSVPADPAPANHDPCHGPQRHTVPLDAPDIALRGQRLLINGERLCQEEPGTEIAEQGRVRHPARPHRPMTEHQLPEMADRQPPEPSVANAGEDIRAVGRFRPPRAEERIYMEPGGGGALNKGKYH